MSEPYEVTIQRTAQKQLGKAPGNVRGRLEAAIKSLARDPRPPGCKKMSGFGNLWRIREGDWRVIYEIFDKQLVVNVVECAPRKDVYSDY